MITSDELRRLFLDFFKKEDHTIVKSSKVVPEDDPTLLFTNAGMNQFKKIILGIEKPAFRRAASVQKCIRASGKHNDLEDVGKDGRHHTFFEMLGNWSFGDYYKKEAIRWAWEFLTQGVKLPVEHLWASVYKDDDEAYDIWMNDIGIAPDRLVRLGDIQKGDEENFWSMGETGPCGPCSELYYEYPPSEKKDFLEGTESGTIVELWNLVFMEFDRTAEGTYSPLPAKHIDTGLGLERTLAVLQGVRSNYETDLFRPLISRMEELSGRSCSADSGTLVSYQVIADHIRALSFAIADGAVPSNEGRGYVLRRILRRAVRHGKLLGVDEPFMYVLVDVLISIMKSDYPEIEERRGVIEEIIKNEEKLFLKTLDRGLEEFNKTIGCLSKGSELFPGESAFVLHDTYGFPFDLTCIMAEENGLKVDRHGFEREMEKQRQRAKRDTKFQAEYSANNGSPWVKYREDAATEFTGYRTLEQEKMRVIRYREENGVFSVVFDCTPFYGESGGQVGDAGIIEGGGVVLKVQDVERDGDIFIHICRVEGGEIQDSVYTGRVEQERRKRIMANHTATHLLHYALRSVVGEHATQAGSLVAPDRLRFDFNHYRGLTADQLDHIEEMVNEAVFANIPVEVYEDIPFAEAQAMGAVALFGEKYGERVRVVKINAVSTELCGGTHAQRTGDIGLFRISREGSISSGIRRIEAVTRVDSFQVVKRDEKILRELSLLLNTETTAVAEKVKELQESVRELQKKLKKERKRGVGDSFDLKKDFFQTGKYRTAHLKLNGFARDEMRELADRVRTRVPDGVALITSVADGRLNMILCAGDIAVKEGAHAGKLLARVLGEFGGKGGGRSHLAEGGGIGPGDAQRVFERLQSLLK